MKIERLTLSNFRSYKKRIFYFKDLNVIVAPNGSGKTNILEAIYLLASGQSERVEVGEEMIHFDSEIGSVAGVVEHNEERVELSIVLTRGQYMGKRTPKRRYLVDGVARVRAGFVGRLAAVMFRPEDMRLIEGSPSRRREYLDETLSMAHSEYDRALHVYQASLKRRNKLLDAIREGVAKREQLTYWDQSIIKNGNIVTDYRRDYLEYLGEVKTAFGQYQMVYDASTISESRLAQYSEAEVALGYTLVGPHKDDFIIMSEGRDLTKYGSRGEQRLAVLFLKLGNLQYLEDKLRVKSVLLLDDIFSELDEEHRKEVVEMTKGRQTIITSAEEEVRDLLVEAERICIIVSD